MAWSTAAMASLPCATSHHAKAFTITCRTHSLSPDTESPCSSLSWAAPGVCPCIPWNTHDFCDKHKYMYTCIMIQHVSLLNVSNM